MWDKGTVIEICWINNFYCSVPKTVCVEFETESCMCCLFNYYLDNDYINGWILYKGILETYTMLTVKPLQCYETKAKHNNRLLQFLFL